MTTKKKFKMGWGMKRRTMVQGDERPQLVLIMRFDVLQKTMRWQSLPFINLLKPTGYVMHQQFSIQQLYTLPTLYLCFVFI
jgi:cytochrome b subunit of formate dehydrogenase